MKPEDDPAWVAELVADMSRPPEPDGSGGWSPPSTCVVCDRSPAHEIPVGVRRWVLCSNPGCRALVEPVRTIGELAEVRKAGE